MALTEIIFHGRGGQGAVTAANILASSAIKSGNKGVQTFPLFGAERRGAPVKAFARISDEEIYVRSQIYEPDIVVVLDTGIMDSVDVTAGLKKDIKVGGIPVVNTPIVGTLPRVMKNLSIEKVKEAIMERWKGDAGKKNALAAEDAYKTVRIK